MILGGVADKCLLAIDIPCGKNFFLKHEIYNIYMRFFEIQIFVIGILWTHMGSSGLEMVTSGAPEAGSDFRKVVVLFGVPHGV